MNPANEIEINNISSSDSSKSLDSVKTWKAKKKGVTEEKIDPKISLQQLDLSASRAASKSGLSHYGEPSNKTTSSISAFR